MNFSGSYLYGKASHLFSLNTTVYEAWQLSSHIGLIKAVFTCLMTAPVKFWSGLLAHQCASSVVFHCSELWRNPSSGMLFRLIIAGRQLPMCFFDYKGIYLETVAWFWETVHWKWSESRHHSVIMTPLVVRVFLAKKLMMIILDHPVYLLDLTLCDFGLFQNWRLLLKGWRFPDICI